jgi:pimeloyl-ACP methyl ester carboxylesterase
MVTLRLDHGGNEMTQPAAGLTATRTPADQGNAPTLLLIHGFLDDASVWDGVIDSLAGEVAAVRYDLPGFGQRSASVADPGDLSLAALAAEAADILTRIDPPVIVVGQSLGSQVAELIAAQHPDRVRALVLLTPVPLGGTRLPDEAVAPFRAFGGDAAAQRAVRAQLSPQLSVAQLDRLSRGAGSVVPAVAARYVDLWNDGVDDAPSPSAFRGPVLVIRGGADAFVTEELLEEISPRFPGASVRVIDQGGHWVHVEYPKAVATMILEFTRQNADAVGSHQ